MRQFPGYSEAAGVLLALFLLVAAPAAWEEGGGEVRAEGSFLVDTRDAGEPAPGFTLPLLEGGEAGLEDYRGRTVLVHFWASWCASCREEFPELLKLVNTEKDVVVIAVAGDSFSRARGFMRELGINPDTGPDHGMVVVVDRYGEVMSSYGVRFLPTTVIVAPDGAVAGRADGPRGWSAPGARRFLGDVPKP